MDRIVIISTSSGSARGGGSGFIARQEGNTYIFTNQHVLLGMDHASFRTAAGKTLHPTAVELSYARDIARLPVNEEVGHFRLSDDIGKQEPIVIMGNSGGVGVAREVFGQILEVDDHLMEVTAEFVSGNSGSPLVLTNEQVVGIASYVTGYVEDAEGQRTRRFCYRIVCDDWKAVNWRTYNSKVGRQYREYEAFVETVERLYEAWAEAPYGRLVSDNLEDGRLKNWAKRHNEMIDGLIKFGERKYAGHKQLEQANDEIKEEMRSRARVLVMLCRKSARDLLRLADQKNCTGFLKKEYRRFAAELEFTAKKAELTGRLLADRDYFYFK
jgi:hypothetical protein